MRAINRNTHQLEGLHGTILWIRLKNELVFKNRCKDQLAGAQLLHAHLHGLHTYEHSASLPGHFWGG